MVTLRLAGPVLEKIIHAPASDDPATRIAMADDILQERVARWPIVNLIHTLLQPIFVLLRAAVSRADDVDAGADAIVESVMHESGESVAALVQSAFVQLRQSQPAVAVLYSNNKLWEEMPADLAAAGLRRTLAETVEQPSASPPGSTSAAAGSSAQARSAGCSRSAPCSGFRFFQPILLALARPAPMSPRGKTTGPTSPA